MDKQQYMMSLLEINNEIYAVIEGSIKGGIPQVLTLNKKMLKLCEQYYRKFGERLMLPNNN